MLIRKITSLLVIGATLFNLPLNSGHIQEVDGTQGWRESDWFQEEDEEYRTIAHDIRMIDELIFNKGKICTELVFMILNFIAAGSKLRGTRLGLEDIDRAFTGNTNFIDEHEHLVWIAQGATLLTHGLSSTLSSSKVVDAFYFSNRGVRPIAGESTRVFEYDSKKIKILKRLAATTTTFFALYLTICYLVQEGEKPFVNNGCTSTGSCEPLWEQLFWEIVTLGTHGFDAVYSNLILVDEMAKAVSLCCKKNKKGLMDANLEALLHHDGEIDPIEVENILRRKQKKLNRCKKYLQKIMSGAITIITIVPTYTVKFLQTYKGFNSFVQSEGVSAGLSASAVLSMAPLEAQQPHGTVEGALSFFTISRAQSNDFNRVKFHIILQIAVGIFVIVLGVLAMPDATHSAYKALGNEMNGMQTLLYSFVIVYSLHSLLSSVSACSKIIYQGCSTIRALRNPEFRELWSKFRAYHLDRDRMNPKQLRKQASCKGYGSFANEE